MTKDCPLLGEFSFSKLIAPTSADDFFDSYWESRPLIIGRDDAAFYQGLFSLEDFDGIAAHAPTRLRAALHKTDSTASEAEASYGRELPLNDREAVMAELRNGSSLILNDAHHRDPRIGRMCRLLEQEFNFPFQANAYLTPANGKGFSAHYDDRDVFLLQIEGSKDWQISRKRVTIPKRGEPKDPDAPKFMADAQELTVRAGDLIYIPGGFVHEAQASDETSLHVTLGLETASWEDLLTAAVKMLVLSDNDLRSALPVGFIGNKDSETAGHLQDIIARLAKPEFLTRVVQQFSDEFIAKFQPDTAGQITGLFGKQALTIDESVGSRPGLVFRRRQVGDTIVILVGGRQISFPDFLDEALAFCMDTERFRVKDLPGDYEDDEKLVVVERLLQEGLLVKL